MEKEPRKYTEEFKRQIIELYENGKSALELAREYGLVEQTIYKWKKKYGTVTKTPEGEIITQADIKVMQKRIAELEIENEILKKATAIFAKSK